MSSKEKGSGGSQASPSEFPRSAESAPGTQGAEGNRKPGETGADRKVWELSEGIPGQSLT